jgi:hypothetical protein
MFKKFEKRAPWRPCSKLTHSRNLQKEEHSSGRTDGNNIVGHEPIIAELLDLMETVQVGLSLPVRLSKKKQWLSSRNRKIPPLLSSISLTLMNIDYKHLNKFPMMSILRQS